MLKYLESCENIVNIDGDGREGEGCQVVLYDVSREHVISEKILKIL